MISCLIETEMTSITITIEIFSNKSIYFYVIAKLYDINKGHFIMPSHALISVTIKYTLFFRRGLKQFLFITFEEI